MRTCEFCKGYGVQYIFPCLSYLCPDCEGSGFFDECKVCGYEVPGNCIEEGVCVYCRAKELDEEMEAIND